MANRSRRQIFFRSRAGQNVSGTVATDHLPLYRQSVIYARDGVDLDRALLAGWVGAASALLRPLVDAIRRHVLAAIKLHADDTPIPVLAPGNGKTKTARLWTYVRDDRASGDLAPAAVWFAYSPDRKGIQPQTHLANFGDHALSICGPRYPAIAKTA